MTLKKLNKQYTKQELIQWCRDYRYRLDIFQNEIVLRKVRGDIRAKYRTIRRLY